MSPFQQKKRLISLIVPFVLILIFFSLTGRSFRRVPWYEEAFWNLVAPPQRAVTFVTEGVKNVWRYYFYLVGVRGENESLKKRVAVLERALVSTKEVEEENSRLRGLLAYQKSFPQKSVVARVIANDPRAEFKSVTIDRGLKDGIGPQMPVVASHGLVGRIGKVDSRTARVLLITDPNSVVDVMTQRSRARGILVGVAARTELRPGYYLTRLEYLRRVSDIRDGDIAVTSGFDRVFPPGIPVGSVHDIAASRYGVFREANVVPFENMAELQEVLVLQSPAMETTGGGE